MAGKIKYRVIGGTHSQNGKKYTAGDIFESDVPLDHFQNKFENLSALAATGGDGEEAASFSIQKAGRRFQVVDAEGDPVHDETLTKKQATALLEEKLSEEQDENGDDE